MRSPFAREPGPASNRTWPPELHARGRHPGDVGGSLPVPELADVVVTVGALPREPLPAEEDVAGRLHQPLAGDDPFTVVGELARRR